MPAKSKMLKPLSGPFRHFFNSRFTAIHQSVVQGNQADERLQNGLDSLTVGVHGLGTTTREVEEGLQVSLGLIGRAIDDLSSRVDNLTEMTADGARDGLKGGTADQLDAIARRLGTLNFDVTTQGELAQLAAYEAAVANYAHAHNGWAAQAGLWFNPPLSIGHAEGGVSLSHVNERIAEVPYVFRQLSGLRTGARVLDVGSTESTVPLSLASLGYRVTAVDPRPYPLEHPNLTTFQGPIADFTADEPFDAIILLSSIEHFGIGSYDLDEGTDADLRAMEHVRSLTREGTRLILTTPYGDAPTTALERTYGPDRLETLLEGWTVEDRSYLTRDSATQWHWAATVDDLSGQHVVLVTATATASPA